MFQNFEQETANQVSLVYIIVGTEFDDWFSTSYVPSKLLYYAVIQDA